MASYHLSAKVFSRGQGHSAVAAASYRARCAMVDERTGETHDYTRHPSQCLFSGIYAPKDAPDWAHDRARLWNHVEAFEKHHKAELAREYEISLPHEMTLEQQRRLLQDFVRENFTRKGLIADVAIHAPHPGHDERNVHAHVLVVMRKLDGTEFIRRKEQFATYTEKQAAKVADLVEKREAWANLANRHLERYGYEDRIDHRSLEAQGIGRQATQHMGKAASAMERRGLQTNRGDQNREAANQNERSARQAEQEKQRAEAQLKATQRRRQAEAARFRAEQEAEQQRQHEKRPPRRGTPEGDISQALTELARTDPLRFGPAAEAARMGTQRSVTSWGGVPAGQAGQPAYSLSVSLTFGPLPRQDAARVAQPPAPEAVRTDAQHSPFELGDPGHAGLIARTLMAARELLTALGERLEQAFRAITGRQPKRHAASGQTVSLSLPADFARGAHRDPPVKTSAPEATRQSAPPATPRRSIWDDELRAAQKEADAPRQLGHDPAKGRERHHHGLRELPSFVRKHHHDRRHCP